MHVIAFNTTSRTITGEARDALVELIMKNGAWDELVSVHFVLRFLALYDLL